MRRNKIHIFLICLLSVAVLSCGDSGKKSDTGGDTHGDEISIAYLKSLYAGHPFRITRDYRIKGCVMSTDAYGNYYKTLAIQDETGGIEIRIDREKLYQTFSKGHIVELHCNSLTLGAYSGVIQIGAASAGSYEVGYIDWNMFTAHLSIVGQAVSDPEAMRLSITELSSRHVSCLVRFYDVQFTDGDIGRCWAGDSGAGSWSAGAGKSNGTGSQKDESGDDTENGDADDNRRITDRYGNELIVRTSPEASFAGWVLPAGSGNIEGILSYFNGSYQLRVIDPARAVMYGERFTINH